MLTHSYLQISGGEGNSTWQQAKRKIQFLKNTKSLGVPVFFLQARDIQAQALHVQMSKMWGMWNYSYCLWAKKHVLPIKLFLPKKERSLVAPSKQRDCQTFCPGTKAGNIFLWQLRRAQNQVMIITLKAICGFDGNIYGNGGTVEFGLLFSELELAWTRKSRVPFQWDSCRMLQSFVRIYDTPSLSDFKNTSPVLQFWCHNLQTFIDGQIRSHLCLLQCTCHVHVQDRVSWSLSYHYS